MESKFLRQLRRSAFSGVRFPNFALPEELVKEGVEITLFEGASLPGGNTKAITALGILLADKEAGRLEGVRKLIEATSGNTGKILAALAQDPEFGIPNVTLIMEPDVPFSKSFSGSAFGAKIIPPHDGMSTIATARLLGQEDGCYNPDQYSNPGGLTLHRSYTGPEIVEALGEVPDVLVASIGASTTIGGAGQYLVGEGPCERIGVLLENFEESPGMRDKNGMKDINLPWESYIDRLELVLSKESWYMSLAACRATRRSFGPSSGSALIAAINAMRKMLKSGEIERLRTKGRKKIVVAVIGPDGFESYPDRYNAYIHRSHSRPGVLPLPWKVLPERHLSFVH